MDGRLQMSKICWLLAYVSDHCLQVILIASLDANVRQDRQIAGHQINYISSGSTGDTCQHLGWEQLEVIIPTHEPACCCCHITFTQDVSQPKLLVMQGGLMADLGQQQSLLPPWTLIKAFQHSSISYTCIAVFADAMRVADAVNQYLHLLIQQQPQPNGKHHASKGVMSLPSPWLAPLSWKYVYGPASSRGFY